MRGFQCRVLRNIPFRSLMIFASAIVMTVVSSLSFAAPASNAGPDVKAAPVAAVTSSQLPERIIRPMRAITPMAVRAEGVTIRLWGIKPAYSNETLLEIKALELMDALIQEQQVNCKITGGTMPELTGRCSTQGDRDLALELLNNGYAAVDRQQTYDSVFASAYEKAQEAARVGNKGFWATGAKVQKETFLPSWVTPLLQVLLPIGLIFGPFGGLVILAFVARHWLKNMSEQQQNEANRSHAKEERLQTRERLVLITTLESELLDNKSKIEAFLVIYKDMLNDLKSSGDKPRYQEAGDIIQKHPNFSKLVFESNIAKLSLLEMKQAGTLSKLYSMLPKENEYINIEPTVSLDTAVALVEKVIQDAEELIPPIDAAIVQLQEAIST